MAYKPEQYNRDDLKTMTHKQIRDAHEDGHLQDILSSGDAENPYRPYGANKSTVGEPMDNRD